jgi:hypothetical protein
MVSYLKQIALISNDYISEIKDVSGGHFCFSDVLGSGVFVRNLIIDEWNDVKLHGLM